MTNATWHEDFNPSKFLARVNLAQLIERNGAFNEHLVMDAKSACIFCTRISQGGILLSDKSFLCQSCYSDVAMISYPEAYETLRRRFLVATEARKLAWEGFSGQFECAPESSLLVPLGWASILLALAFPAFLIVTVVMLAMGYQNNAASKRRADEWVTLRRRWEEANPVPDEPVLKHFHDPSAILTQRDQQILRIFNHWPGYPPFWKYLRAVVISRDFNRCQVTGCPSRLTLHVHHMRPVADGGPHSPDNLVSLCDFHHALEPEKGHERIWGDIKTRYFTLVCSHERGNRASGGHHTVRAHLRRLELVTLDELQGLAGTYGFCCPSCGESRIKFTLYSGRNIVRIECPSCEKATEGPQQLAEETGPLLAEILGVTRNRGRWKARWDMLSERRTATWGAWSGCAVTAKRKQHKTRVAESVAAPECPKCGSPMRRIRPQKMDHWKAFWGCTQYPVTGCRGSINDLADR